MAPLTQHDDRRVTIAHLMASPFFGGPERQVLGMASALPDEFRSIFLSFAEHGLADDFVKQAQTRGFLSRTLHNNANNPLRAIREIRDLLLDHDVDVLICHGYKPDVLGYLAARRGGRPIVAVSRGWTAHTWKVRLNEAIDRRFLRLVDHVVCVSRGQADRVLRAGVPSRRVSIIRNAINLDRFAGTDPSARSDLISLFPAECPPSKIVLAAGRLSPEKGFEVLLSAATRLRGSHPELGVVVLGDGPLRDDLDRRIRSEGLRNHFILAGFRRDLDRLIPAADLVAIPSFTEGLPNVALEASAARRPVIATSVGGIPEIITSGLNGLLVPPGQPHLMADAIAQLLANPNLACEMGEVGRFRVEHEFGFETQAESYAALLRRLTAARPRVTWRLPNSPEPNRSLRN